MVIVKESTADCDVSCLCGIKGEEGGGLIAKSAVFNNIKLFYDICVCLTNEKHIERSRKETQTIK